VHGNGGPAVPQDLLDLYFRAMEAVPLLAPDEEVDLAKRIEAGREAARRLHAGAAAGRLPAARRQQLEACIADGHQAFDQFVAANLRLVVKEALRVSRRTRLELPDLIQEGNLGLIRAVEKFDWRRGLKFSTYAAWWIRQALQRGMARHERVIRLPLRVHSNLLKVRVAEARLFAELGRPPCLDELAEATGLTEQGVREALSADYRVVSLDRPVSENDDAAELGALLARASESLADEVVEHVLANSVAQVAQRELPARSWYVLQRRLGLGQHEPATLQQIGQDLGISREAVRKIERQALILLRARLMVEGQPAVAN
jgi:RNA polymerase nonessential primary-like sigma factor